MRFKQYIQNEGFFGDAFNFIKTKIGNFFNKIKSFVLRSARVEKNAVVFSFPKFEDLNENLIDFAEPVSQKRVRSSRTPLNAPRSSSKKIEYIIDLLKTIDDENLSKYYTPEYLSSLPSYKIKEIAFQLEKTQQNTPLDVVSIKELTPSDMKFLGLLFEIECYFMVLKKGFEDCKQLNLPPWYMERKSRYINYYEQILKHVDELTNLMIDEARKTMPCVDCVLFSGGGDGARWTGRQDPADIKFACKENVPDQIGYSVKYKLRENNLIALGSYKTAQQDFDAISNVKDFVNFLNKMLTEYNKTHLLLGGEKPYNINKYIQEYLDVDPNDSSKFIAPDSPATIQRKNRIIYFKGMRLYMPPKSSTVLLGLNNLTKDFKKPKDDSGDENIPF